MRRPRELLKIRESERDVKFMGGRHHQKYKDVK